MAGLDALSLAQLLGLKRLVGQMQGGQQQAAPRQSPQMPPVMPIHAAMPGPGAPGSGQQPHLGQSGGVNWGGQNFAHPEQVVAWINAHGGNTSLGQFLSNHPGVAAHFGQRQAQQQAHSVLPGLSAQVRPRPSPPPPFRSYGGVNYG